MLLVLTEMVFQSHQIFQNPVYVLSIGFHLLFSHDPGTTQKSTEIHLNSQHIIKNCKEFDAMPFQDAKLDIQHSPIDRIISE